MSGFILSYRNVYKNPVFRKNKIEASVFVWMYHEANYDDGNVYYKDRNINLKRGQLAISLRDIARAWGWSEPTVRRYLKRLTDVGMIDAASDAGVTVITICNYDKYQRREHSADAPSDAEATQGHTQSRRTSDAQKETNKQINNKTSSTPKPPHLFPEFWDLFPRQRRGSKQKAEKAYLRAVHEGRGTPEEIVSGLKRYGQSSDVARGFASGAEAWLNDDGWTNEYLTEAQEKELRNGQRPANIQSTGDTRFDAWATAASLEGPPDTYC